eukprot:4079888-Karenia_brevis.AAC.1
MSQHSSRANLAATYYTSGTLDHVEVDENGDEDEEVDSDGHDGDSADADGDDHADDDGDDAQTSEH